jgi:lipopolysaccharide/colanic/teichoic acid biosynthesis glycosyltransferase
VLLVLAIAVQIDSPGPALFTQQRVGRRGRTFRCYKLRTMCTDAEARLYADRTLRESYVANGYKLPVDCDPRVTRFGRLLRATSLDELPQLWNVLRGEMSMVGPRPIVDAEIPKYREAYDLYRRVKPGMSGLWQVSGRSSTSYDERVQLDTYYVRNWSVWIDLVILVRTVGAVVFSRGAI